MRNSKKTRVLTYNVCGLPVFSVAFGKRMSLIRRALEQMEEVDIVCLQEVWQPFLKEYFYRALRRRLPYACYKSQGWRLGGGLLVLSRYPLEKKSFKVFKSKGVPWGTTTGDWWAGKGYIKAWVRRKGGGGFWLINTHLNAVFDGRFEESNLAYRVIGKQIGEILSEVRRLRERGKVVVLAGDLNIPKTVGHWQKIAVLKPQDVLGDEKAMTINKSHIFWGRESELARRDYVLVFGRKEVKVQGRVVFDDKLCEFRRKRCSHLSDHLGVWGEISI